MKIVLTATVTQVIEVDDDLDMVERMRKVTNQMETIASDFEIDGWDTITDFNFSVVDDDDDPATVVDNGPIPDPDEEDEADEEDEDDEDEEDEEDGDAEEDDKG
jgi:hypothetical protein